MAAPCGKITFHVAVEKILNSWTVLQLAVQHGFGGADSVGKGKWLVEALVQWFQENDNLEVYEVEDFLADILNAEFDTIADDGSLSQVSQNICECYSLCSRGQDALVLARLDKLPKPDLAQCRVSQDQNSADGQEDGSDDGEQMDCSDGASAPTLVSANSGQVQHTQQEPESESSQMEAEEDGWTTVSKKGKKR